MSLYTGLNKHTHKLTVTRVHCRTAAADKEKTAIVCKETSFLGHNSAVYGKVVLIVINSQTDYCYIHSKTQIFMALQFIVY